MSQDMRIPRREVLKAAGVTSLVGGAGGIVSAEPGKADNREITELRRATAKYHDVEVARSDGYGLPEPHCVSHPTEDAAMGYHFIKPELIDGSVNPTQPEVLVYEERGGEYHLVAVEFLSTASDPPSLFGHDFHPFPQPVADWALHVWAWKDNPDGLFADFNPRVECP